MIMSAGVAHAQDETETISSSFDLMAANGVEYRIFTAAPSGEAPAGGRPVVYLTDGNATFPPAVKVMAEAGMKAVLVGIGYPIESREEIVRLRYFDLTPETPADLIPLREDASPPRTGGQDAFLAFIENELRPEIERRFAVDRTHQTLFGHSLGGLFALHVLFTRPDAFQTYGAADPSIWWNGRSILSELGAFLQARKPEDPPVRLLIENAGKKAERRLDSAAAARRAELRSGPNGKDVYEALAAAPGVRAAGRTFPDETHGTMIPPAVADTLRFALMGVEPGGEQPTERRDRRGD